MKSRQAKRLSAGIIITRLIYDQRQFLLLRAFNYWDFPKGLVEPGETRQQTAIRETAEETTITDLKFTWGDDYIDTSMYGDRKVASYFVAETAQKDITLPVNPEIGKPEHHEFRWLDYTAARSLLNDRLKPIIDWANEKME
jgi:bis(5'-nucleosidyl)-tetraphosphatase